ncbi:hypothetical protein BGX28_004021 [Mortierella sp. GBA30]|nr:hypothetical protein BGX28_004021 [Mortierella sp. GBA30]
MLNPLRTEKSPLLGPASTSAGEGVAGNSTLVSMDPSKQNICLASQLLVDVERIPKRLLQRLKERTELASIDWSLDIVDLSVLWTSEEPVPTYDEYIGISSSMKASQSYPSYLDDIDVLDVHLTLSAEEPRDTNSKNRARKWDLLELRVDQTLDQGEKWMKEVSKWTGLRADAIERHRRAENSGVVEWHLNENEPLVEEPEQEDLGWDESQHIADDSRALLRPEDANKTQRWPSPGAPLDTQNGHRKMRELSLISGRDLNGSLSSFNTSMSYTFKTSLESTRESVKEMRVFLVDCRQRLQQLHEATGTQLREKEPVFKEVVDKFTMEWNESYFVKLKEVEDQIQVMNLKRIENPWMDMLLIMLSWLIRGLFYIVEGVTIMIIIVRHAWSKAKHGYRVLRNGGEQEPPSQGGHAVNNPASPTSVIAKKKQKERVEALLPENRGGGELAIREQRCGRETLAKSLWNLKASGLCKDLEEATLDNDKNRGNDQCKRTEHIQSILKKLALLQNPMPVAVNDGSGQITPLEDRVTFLKEASLDKTSTSEASTGTNESSSDQSSMNEISSDKISIDIDGTFLLSLTPEQPDDLDFDADNSTAPVNGPARDELKASQGVLKTNLEDPKITGVVDVALVKDKGFVGNKFIKEQCQVVATIANVLRPFIPRRQPPTRTKKTKNDQVLHHVALRAPLVIIANAVLRGAGYPATTRHISPQVPPSSSHALLLNATSIYEVLCSSLADHFNINDSAGRPLTNVKVVNKHRRASGSRAPLYRKEKDAGNGPFPIDKTIKDLDDQLGQIRKDLRAKENVQSLANRELRQLSRRTHNQHPITGSVQATPPELTAARKTSKSLKRSISTKAASQVKITRPTIDDYSVENSARYLGISKLPPRGLCLWVPLTPQPPTPKYPLPKAQKITAQHVKEVSGARKAIKRREARLRRCGNEAERLAHQSLSEEPHVLKIAQTLDQINKAHQQHCDHVEQGRNQEHELASKDGELDGAVRAVGVRNTLKAFESSRARRKDLQTQRLRTLRTYAKVVSFERAFIQLYATERAEEDPLEQDAARDLV